MKKSVSVVIFLTLVATLFLGCGGKHTDNVSETIVSAPSLTVLSPNGGEVFEPGDTVQIKWSAKGIKGRVGIYISDDRIFDSGSTNYVSFPSMDSLEIPIDQGYYNWIVPNLAVLPNGDGDGKNYRICILTQEELNDCSDKPFSIEETSRQAPSVTTGSASNIAQDSVTLTGVVNPNGLSASVWFEYGTSVSLGNITVDISTGSVAEDQNATATISNLQENTTYYYRIVASNSFGITYGKILSFTTSGQSVESLLSQIAALQALIAQLQSQQTKTSN